MKAAELEDKLQAGLAKQGIVSAAVKVEPDIFEGWLIRVVAEEFSQFSETERRRLVESNLVGELVVWRQYLSPEEMESAMPMPSEQDEGLPLWPESLARGERQAKDHSLATFLSDSSDSVAPPLTVTFYSLRGGVGRSTALSHTARLLASSEKKVVCVDMDLEAPGLASLFNVEGAVEKGQGVVELLVQLDQGEEPDFSRHLVPVNDNDQIFLVPAGLPDAGYARDLSLIDPSAWYSEDSNPLRELMDGIRNKLPFVPDVILVDSRTGISAISAPLLFEQADMAIVAFFPHEQAYLGTKALVQGLMGARNWRSLHYDGHSCGPEIRFLAGPLPTGTHDARQHFENQALEWVADWLAPAQGARRGAELLELDESELMHWVPYRDELATSRNIFEVDDVAGLYGKVQEWIDALVSDAGSAQEDGFHAEKLSILKDLRVESGAAEYQDDLLEVFIETDVVRKAITTHHPLILGRKGTGKTALFRKISEQSGEDRSVLSVLSPAVEGSDGLALGSTAFKEIDSSLVSPGIFDWKQVWMIYALILTVQRGVVNQDLLEDLDSGPLPENAYQLIEWMSFLSQKRMASLKLEDAFSTMDLCLEKPLMLLWDGLDTGFGNEPTSRRRREAALVGLLSLVLEWEKRSQNVFFKILLREDIWRDLRFENKSHLFGRSVVLRWDDKISFLKVLVKQLWRSGQFREWLGDTSEFGSQLLASNVEHWSDEIVLSVWHRIAGVRMGSGKAAFTQNWIWKRLGDSNNDHAPRHLLQLFDLSIEKEKELEQKTPYTRSLVRPNTLAKVLPEVSERALDALINEEFKELQPLVETLTEIGRTPFEADKLVDVEKELVLLAKEVGLLGVHEGTDQQVERYRVPELYRLGLKMARKGQA